MARSIDGFFNVERCSHWWSRTPTEYLARAVSVWKRSVGNGTYRIRLRAHSIAVLCATESKNNDDYGVVKVLARQ